MCFCRRTAIISFWKEFSKQYVFILSNQKSYWWCFQVNISRNEASQSLMALESWVAFLLIQFYSLILQILWSREPAFTQYDVRFFSFLKSLYFSIQYIQESLSHFSIHIRYDWCNPILNKNKCYYFWQISRSMLIFDRITKTSPLYTRLFFFFHWQYEVI